MDNMQPVEQKPAENEMPAASKITTRMVFGIILVVVGIIMLFNDQPVWGWVITGLGVLSIIYNAVMMKKGK